MSKRFNPLSTAVAIAVATAMIGGCAMQTRTGDMARADTEDASHPSTNTTLTAQGDPAPDVMPVALVETTTTVVAQADPMPVPPAPPAPPAPAAQPWNNPAQAAPADPMQANRTNPTPPAMTSSSTTMPSQSGTSSADANASYGNSEPALAPRADRN